MPSQRPGWYPCLARDYPGMILSWVGKNEMKRQIEAKGRGWTSEKKCGDLVPTDKLTPVPFYHLLPQHRGKNSLPCSCKERLEAGYGGTQAGRNLVHVQRRFTCEQGTETGVKHTHINTHICTDEAPSKGCRDASDIMSVQLFSFLQTVPSASTSGMFPSLEISDNTAVCRPSHLPLPS